MNAAAEANLDPTERPVAGSAARFAALFGTGFRKPLALVLAKIAQ